jgi:saccharopine dehydrogenase-like NADP-dependent oxidoreductase
MIVIRNLVEKHFNLDISNKSRKFKYVFARACYYKICRDFGGYTYHKIAKTLDKNHATVLHALKELEFMAKHDKYYLKKYNSLMKKFNLKLFKTLNFNEMYKGMTLQQLVQDYNLLLLENEDLKSEIKGLENSIYYLAEL